MSFQNDIKPYFETGDFPTQSQFYEAFTKLRWKDELLFIADITDLTTILNGLATPVETFTTTAAPLAYTIPAGYLLEDIILKPVADATVRCDNQGTAVPGDVMPDDAVTAGSGAVWSVKKFAPAALTIVVVGMPAGSKIYFIKRKIF